MSQRHRFTGVRDNNFDTLNDLENYVNRRDGNTRSLQEWFGLSENKVSSQAEPFSSHSSLSRPSGRIYQTRFTEKDYIPPSPRAKRVQPDTKTEKYVLPSCSQEQAAIVKASSTGHSVIVDSVFGSGKTTTILQICAAHPDIPILVLTYNARLKIETREKTAKLGFHNVETHSYHALAVRYYDSQASTDTKIQEIIHHNKPARQKRPVGLIILDEQQDMTPLYFQLVEKYLHDMDSLSAPPPKMVLLGDTYQNIYGYKGADARFLQLADQLFASPYLSWKRLQITTSFRTTQPIANFINRHLIGHNRVHSVKSGGKVRYLICDAFNKTPYIEIKSYLRQGYRPSDIYILAPSLRAGREHSPIRKLENRLVNEGIPCFVPTDDQDELTEEVTRGKVVFSTFHQIKGSERPVVLVFSFDASYFDYYARNESRTKCPNPVYVALSRSLERLVVIHHYENDYFPLLQREYLHKDPNVRIVQTRQLFSKRGGSYRTPKTEIDTPVTELLRHLDNNMIQQSKSYYSQTVIKSARKALQIPNRVPTGNGKYEGVAEISGIALPMSFELTRRSKICSVLTNLIRKMEYFPENHQQRIMSIRHRIYASDSGNETSPIPMSDILYLSNLYNSLVSGYNSKREQITTYNWVSEAQSKRAQHRLGRVLHQGAKFEEEFSKCILGRRIIGYVDANQKTLDQEVPETELWEIKCTGKLEPEHAIQLLIYGWIYQCHHGKTPKLYLYNVLTDEQVKLSVRGDLGELMVDLIESRYGQKDTDISDETFLARLKNPNTKKTHTIVSQAPTRHNDCLIGSDSESE